jgi:drug/metabolite transporter (DMT)-like permease
LFSFLRLSSQSQSPRAALPMHLGNPFNLATKHSKQMTPTRLFILTLLAMIAFASNSLLCRAALKQTGIDAASFTFIRIFSGAVALWLIATMRHGRPVVAVHDRRILGGNWLSALALFAYAAAFSFAYVSLSAGTGALLLFAAVQATMILWGLRRGERLGVRQLVGLALALIGLVALLFPGLSAPPLSGAILMLGAGVAWGIYSLRGKAAGDVITATTGNFLRAVPLAVVLIIAFLPWTHVDRAGIGYAVLSGAIASGVGYVIWYSALGGLKAASAATVQLSVPVLAATGGILLLGEPITFRYLLASIAVLGGIALVVIEKNQSGKANDMISSAAR